MKHNIIKRFMHVNHGLVGVDIYFVALNEPGSSQKSKDARNNRDFIFIDYHVGCIIKLPRGFYRCV